MEMKTGALVMLDALGFKGIWKRHKPPLDVIGMLQRLREDIRAGVEEYSAGMRAMKQESGEPLFVNVDARVQFLSDTIVIGVVAGEPMIDVTTAAYLAGTVMERAANESPALAYRGVITYGPHLIANEFIIGQAVDEAASHQNLAEGAFVWIAPSARKALADGLELLLEFSPELSLYPVPLKGGGTYETYCVSPFHGNMRAPQREQILARIAETFSDDALAVQVKKQNTSAFLKSASQGLLERDARLDLADAEEHDAIRYEEEEQERD